MSWNENWGFGDIHTCTSNCFHNIDIKTFMCVFEAWFGGEGAGFTLGEIIEVSLIE
jgi:hypothetical protein